MNNYFLSDIKGYSHDESPGGSIRAGSDIDFDSDRY